MILYQKNEGKSTPFIFRVKCLFTGMGVWYAVHWVTS